MDNAALASVYNTISLSLFMVINVLIFSRIGYRWYLYRKAKEKVPVLLKRDLTLFFGIGTYVVAAFLLRILGATGLSTYFPWLIFSSFTILVPFAYWAWVEWHQ